MSSKSDEPVLAVSPLYRQTYEDIRTLKSQLSSEAVEGLAREVIKRLADRTRAEEARRLRPELAQISALAAALIGPDETAAARMMDEALQQQGAQFETLYLGWLAPAADLLGRQWTRDEVTFADVAVGTGRIYAITAIFASLPGEQHTLGVKMAADLFKQDGWDIDLVLDADHDELIDRIAHSGHIIIGLSAGGKHALETLTRVILAIRVSAPDARVLVAGNIVNELPDQIRLTGVDAQCATIEEARAEMDRLWRAQGGGA